MNRMTSRGKPLPLIRPETAPFWAAARRHELVFQQCRACGHRFHFPRLLCCRCFAEDLAWVRASGRGTVYSFTVVRQAAHREFDDAVPYVYAIIELEEGVRLVSNVVDIAPDRVRIGLPVRVVFEDIGPELAIPRFAPAPADKE